MKKKIKEKFALHRVKIRKNQQVALGSNSLTTLFPIFPLNFPRFPWWKRKSNHNYKWNKLMQQNKSFHFKAVIISPICYQQIHIIFHAIIINQKCSNSVSTFVLSSLYYNSTMKFSLIFFVIHLFPLLVVYDGIISSWTFFY